MSQRSNWSHLTASVGTICFLMLPFEVCAQRVMIRAQAVAQVQAQVEEEEEAEGALVQQQARVFWSDDTIDQWIFGSGRNAQQARKRLDTQLSLRIDELDRTCTLTEPQKKKLRLAGQGDIKRLFDEMNEIRKKFDKLRHDQNAVNQIFQEIQPLQTRINAGIFNPTSFYQKSVMKTLGPEQAAKVEQLDFERRKFRYHAKIQLAMTMLDVAVPMRDEQRQKLIKVMQDDTRPPKRFGQYDFQVVMFQMTQLPEEKIKPIFDAAQWNALQTQFRQSKGMENHLRTNGFLDEAPAKVKPAPAVKAKPEPADAEVKKIN